MKTSTEKQRKAPNSEEKVICQTDPWLKNTFALIKGFGIVLLCISSCKQIIMFIRLTPSNFELPCFAILKKRRVTIPVPASTLNEYK